MSEENKVFPVIEDIIDDADKVQLAFAFKALLAAQILKLVGIPIP